MAVLISNGGVNPWLPCEMVNGAMLYLAPLLVFFHIPHPEPLIYALFAQYVYAEQGISWVIHVFSVMGEMRKT